MPSIQLLLSFKESRCDDRTLVDITAHHGTVFFSYPSSEDGYSGPLLAPNGMQKWKTQEQLQ
jgi:hypothetical protein